MKFAGCRGWEERERERKRRREEGIFALYDCRESLAYFTSPRKLLSLHCSLLNNRFPRTPPQRYERRRTGYDGEEGRRRDARGLFFLRAYIDGCASAAVTPVAIAVETALPRKRQ